MQRKCSAHTVNSQQEAMLCQPFDCQINLSVFMLNQSYLQQQMKLYMSTVSKTWHACWTRCEMRQFKCQTFLPCRLLMQCSEQNVKRWWNIMQQADTGP